MDYYVVGMHVQDVPDPHPRPPPDHVSLAHRKSSRDGNAQSLLFAQRRVIRGERVGANREIDDRWELDAEGSVVGNPYLSKPNVDQFTVRAKYTPRIDDVDVVVISGLVAF